MKVSEQDLKELISCELKENNDIYRSKVNVDNICEIFENLTSLDNLDDISEAISSQIHCPVIRLRPNGNKQVLNGRYASYLKESSIYYGFDENTGEFFQVSFPKENIDKFKHTIGLPTMKCDGLGRLHLDTPYSGPTQLKIRSHKYNPTTAATHITDL